MLSRPLSQRRKEEPRPRGSRDRQALRHDTAGLVVAPMRLAEAELTQATVLARAGEWIRRCSRLKMPFARARRSGAGAIQSRCRGSFRYSFNAPRCAQLPGSACPRCAAGRYAERTARGCGLSTPRRRVSGLRDGQQGRSASLHDRASSSHAPSFRPDMAATGRSGEARQNDGPTTEQTPAKIYTHGHSPARVLPGSRPAKPDLLDQCIRRVMAEIKEWGSILFRSSDGQQDPIHLGDIRSNCFRSVLTPDASGCATLRRCSGTAARLRSHSRGAAGHEPRGGGFGTCPRGRRDRRRCGRVPAPGAAARSGWLGHHRADPCAMWGAVADVVIACSDFLLEKDEVKEPWRHGARMQRPERCHCIRKILHG
jgi:hypothetical protein